MTFSVLKWLCFPKTMGNLAENAPQFKAKILFEHPTDARAHVTAMFGRMRGKGGHGERMLFCRATTLPSRGRTNGGLSVVGHAFKKPAIGVHFNFLSIHDVFDHG